LYVFPRAKKKISIFLVGKLKKRKKIFFMVNFVIANTAFGFQINVTVFEQFFKNKIMHVFIFMDCVFNLGRKSTFVGMLAAQNML
jgi:hypothetical protein